MEAYPRVQEKAGVPAPAFLHLLPQCSTWALLRSTDRLACANPDILAAAYCDSAYSGSAYPVASFVTCGASEQHLDISASVLQAAQSEFQDYTDDCVIIVMLPKHPSHFWFHFRFATLLLSFFVVAAGATLEHLLTPAQRTLSPSVIVFCTVGVLAMPVMLQFTVLLQAINPFSDRYWSPPTSYDNPFHLGNPLYCIHFGAFLASAGGLGAVVASIWTGVDNLIIGIFQVLGGASMLISIRFSLRLFKHKIHPVQKAT